MNATDYLESGFLNVLRGQTFAAPANIYLGLFLSSPGETGAAGAEVSYSGYARQLVTFSVPAASGAAVSIQSQAQLTFPKAVTAGGTALHVGLFDSLSGGNCLAYGSLSEGITIAIGESPVVLAGDIKLSLSGQLSTAYKTKLLNLFRGQSITGVSPYLSLWNGDPENSGAELSGGSYARVGVTFSAPAAADSGQMVLEASGGATFPRPTASWGTWAYTALMDAASDGAPICVVQEAAASEIKSGYRPTFEAADIRVALN